jgi:thioredoxin-like negative regulator of GroEL
MAPIVHGLEAKYAGRIGFVYLDIDDGNTAQFKKALGYRLQPNIFLLDKDGNVIQQWLGAVPAAELDAALQAAIQ